MATVKAITITVDSLLPRLKLDCDVGYDAAIKGASVLVVDRGMLHMLQVFQKHIASVCSKCFMSTDVCCNCFFIWMLHVFHTCCNSIFQIFQLFLSYVVASGFMLQVAILDVSCV